MKGPHKRLGGRGVELPQIKPNPPSVLSSHIGTANGGDQVASMFVPVDGNITKIAVRYKHSTEEPFIIQVKIDVGGGVTETIGVEVRQDVVIPVDKHVNALDVIELKLLGTETLVVEDLHVGAVFIPED